MAIVGSILLAGDEPTLIDEARALLEPRGWSVDSVELSQAALRLTNDPPEIVVAFDQESDGEHPWWNPELKEGPALKLVAVRAGDVGCPWADRTIKPDELSSDLADAVEALLARKTNKRGGRNASSLNQMADQLEQEYLVERRAQSAKATVHAHPLEGEYIVRSVKDLNPSDKDPAGERDGIPADRLEVLRRQVQRLARESRLGKKEGLNARRHARRQMGDAVEITPLNDCGKPRARQSVIAFCRDISQGGCALLHPRRLPEGVYRLVFAKGESHELQVVGKVVRHRGVSMGMYDIGIEFFKRFNPVSDAVHESSDKQDDESNSESPKPAVDNEERG